MKTAPAYSKSSKLLMTACCWAALAALCAAPVHAAKPPKKVTPAADTSGEPKSHNLFMGIDVSIEKDGKLYRVQDVSGNNFMILVNGEPVYIPVRGKDLKMKIEDSLKLTSGGATMDNFKAEHTYTPENDPNIKFARQANSGYEALLAQAEFKEMQAQHDAFVSGAAFNVNTTDAASQQGFAAANAALSAAQSDTGLSSVSLSDNVGDAAARRQLELEQALFDAMEFTFDVSSEKTLLHPFVVAVVRYHARGAKPGESRNLIIARAMSPITSASKRVKFQQGGFPGGFEIEDSQIHLFDEGKEVATNVSPKRVPLTRDEAFEYIVMDWVGTHKGATVSASAAMAKLPADFRERYNAGQGTQTFYVKVSKEGKVTEAFRDEACTQKIDDPYVESTIMTVRFKPALEKGKPVDTTAKFKFSDLPI